MRTNPQFLCRPLPLVYIPFSHLKHRGRGVGILGRRPKDQEKRQQMIITNEGDNVYHTLPRQKKSKTKEVHSLKRSVDLNKLAAKKHYNKK